MDRSSEAAQVTPTSDIGAGRGPTIKVVNQKFKAAYHCLFPPCRAARLNRIHAVEPSGLAVARCVGQASRLSPSEKFPSPFGDSQPVLETAPKGDHSKSETGATPVLLHGYG